MKLHFMYVFFEPRRAGLLLLAAGLLLLSGCAAQVSTADIRRDIEHGDFKTLGKALNESFEDRPVMINALNLARFYQFQGEWDESREYFNIALRLLEDYEQRAIISVRNVSGRLGAYTLSRGSVANFGTGYERSLLHTFNGLNYLMKEDFQGAAVEMRRMELRQQLWLEEAEHRLRARVEEEKERQDNNRDNGGGYNAENLPSGYSMGEILRSPELRQVVSSYQDPFSYALSAITCRIYGDSEYARVSLSRACQLDERAYQMFRNVWQRPAVDILDEMAKAERWEPAVPPLPRFYREGAADNPPKQEVVFIFFGGLGPAMKMEQVRIPYPQVGYIMFDLPSYEPAIQARMPEISVSGGELTAYPLLRTDLLAYRNLQDEIGWEAASAVSRAITRAAVSVGGQAVASSNDDTKDYAPLIGLLLTLGMDIFAGKDNDNVRNWELLPARGLLGMTELPRGSIIALTFSDNEYKVEIPKEARGIIILASQVENAKLKVDYVTY